MSKKTSEQDTTEVTQQQQQDMLLVFRVFPPFSHCKAVKPNFLHVLRRYEFELTIYFSPSTRCFLHAALRCDSQKHSLPPTTEPSQSLPDSLPLARVVPARLSLPWSRHMTGLPPKCFPCPAIASHLHWHHPRANLCMSLNPVSPPPHCSPCFLPQLLQHRLHMTGGMSFQIVNQITSIISVLINV